MSNKQKRVQPNTSSEGDKNINTRKGFIISLPSKNKKQAEESQSTIVMAKTVNNNEQKPQQVRSDSQKTDKNTPPQRNEQQKNREKNNRKKNRGGFHNNKNTQNQKDRNAQTERANTEVSSGQNNSQKNNASNSQSNRGQNRKNDKNRRKNEQPASMPILSELSAQINSIKKSRTDFTRGSEREKLPKEDTLTLEQKYANAIPLADQIAEEERKRKRIPKAASIEKIDRTMIANSKMQTTDNTSDDGESAPTIAEGLYEVVGVRFRETGKIYYFDPDGQEISFGTPVIVDTSRGSEYGFVAIANRLVPHTNVIPPLKKLKRIATAADTEKHNANKALETEAANVFKEKVEALKLEMKLIFVEYTFDNSKLLFYFTAEERIDFRELVKELAAIFRTRIELRQIGVRDEAKMMGGLGVCGRCVCCNSFLGDFAQVSIKMAKEQGLSLNSAKISGSCGKLMCCLRYENKVYEEELAITPKVGSVVETDEGRGVVTEANALKGTVKVLLDSAKEALPKQYSRNDVKVVGFNKSAVKEESTEGLEELE